MLTHLDMHERVAGLVTVSSSHRGASLAEFFRCNLHDRLRLYAFFGKFLDIEAAHELTRERFADFNIRGILGTIGPDIPTRWVRPVADVQQLLALR